MSGVILIRGKSGTGKTALSTELSKRLGLPVLRKDDLYDSVADFIPEHGDRNRVSFDILYRFLQKARSLNPLPNQLITDLRELKEHYKDAPEAYMDGELIVDTVRPLRELADEAEIFLRGCR
ncbi:ATP-binding protein [Paenibacillus soyae]|uniref:ATP-binding protein n=1 Tax=Paenibacillus soyae TaxID=2969249 RepID=A0A9X2S9L9_9BACL|nr:ATP-binding protein [Paenibacillus soyae]MCR2805281.1 ATP-binding protein [Paenibacillus soyae]